MRIVGGTHKGRPLIRVNSKSTRETADMVKVAVFNMLGSTLDGRVLDLFAGSGAYGFEALSRGANFADFVDIEIDAIKTLHQNAKQLSFEEKSNITRSDYQRFIKTLTLDKTFDYIFLDPPYIMNIYEEVITSLIPFLSDHCMIICESEKKVVLPEEIHGLTKIKDKTYGIKRISIYQK